MREKGVRSAVVELGAILRELWHNDSDDVSIFHTRERSW